jgi:opacity protein-like surface antigen
MVPGNYKFCFLLFTFLATLTLSPAAHGQGLELGGGYAYTSGNFGTNGFDIDVAWWFNRRLTIAANYDDMWKAAGLTVFTFSNTGAISVHSHLENILVGPRIFFPTQWENKHKVNVFAEVQFGTSFLGQSVHQAPQPTLSGSGTDFTWLLGGGVEYLFTPHWSARGNVDFLRTHFASAGQNHLRLVIGATYTFGARR